VIAFEHPERTGPIRLESTPAEDFARVIGALGWNADCRPAADDGSGTEDFIGAAPID
jgi:hypothetical protein